MAQALHDGRRVGGDVALEHARAGRRLHAFRHQHVFEGDGDARQRPRLARGQACIGGAGHSQGLVAHDREVGVQQRVHGLDALEVGTRERDARYLPCPQLCGGLVGRQFV